MIVPISVSVSIVLFVPVVIVVKSAMVSVPVAREELLAVMVRSHPPSALVWGPRPITSMPLVVRSVRIPITVYPNEVRAWTARLNANHPGLRRRANSDS